jgi:ligand-binding sensor domain-containing protein
MWVGTDFGIAQFDGEKWTRFSTTDGLPDDRITAIEVAPDGSVWCATINGAAVYRDSTWIAFTTQTTGDGLSDDYILDLALGRKKWFGLLPMAADFAISPKQRGATNFHF